MPIINHYFSRVGNDISNATNLNEAITLAGLDFTVQPEKVYDSRGHVIPDTYSIARTDTGESLGVNGARYVPIQTASAFEHLDSLAARASTKFHRGGMLKGGRFFIAVEFPRLTVKGDVSQSFAVFLSSFDGSWANRIASVFHRLACCNICSYAIRANEKSENMGLAAKHTLNASTKLDVICNVIEQREAKQRAFFGSLQSRAMSIAEMRNFAATLFPTKTTQAENSIERLLQLFADESLGQYGKTAFDAFNAITAFETHEGQRRNTTKASADENAFDALVSARSLSNRAAQLLMS